MARRLLTCMLVLAFGMIAPPAQAAATTHNHVKGGFVIAVWDDAQTGTFAVVELFQDVDYLIVILETADRDAGGNITGYTSVDADANLSPYGSFTIDRQHLTTATLAVSGVPTSTCEYDANHEFIGCSDTPTSVAVNVTWTASGPLERSVFAFHEQGDGFVTNFHFVGSDRSAVAAGTIGGTALTADEIFGGGVAFSRSGSMSVCVHC